ncbi:DUF3616 domain-containing protein [Hymenobacter latericus]|uniref:DUF3616 domain-containing protein n=1 Tax=Hymenobacter sp. YIM 151858-1 TaxID=2987688 RepID=UPI00222650E0|nr:DUF3616 domain-containing protein [Hymenobacter sp. YIM 151858-1]UYZ57935.1 DUF3616 domain-containing protein [Hymenobacter sp. YIM 151858-1]
MANSPAAFTLRFDPKLSINPSGKHVRDGLSSTLRTGDNLWMACDERASVERLRLTDATTFGQHCRFQLADFIDLPDPDAEAEIDIEGLAEGDGYLWIVGSHSLRRKDPKPEKDDTEKGLAKLAKVRADPNRYLLARVPLVLNPETQDYELQKTAPDPHQKRRKLKAARLGHHTLVRLLRRDPHVGPFVHLPGKDNGFDIEGMAYAGDGRLFVGLRGPVLRGWAIVLELHVTEGSKPGRLRLGKLSDAQGVYYRKHFLDLGGMGLRELRLVGNDLYLLAGPTMDLDGTIAVFCWPDALHHDADSLVAPSQLRRLFDVPHGFGPTACQDKAEGMALLNEHHVLVVFDSPTDARKPEDDAVLADAFRIVQEPEQPDAANAAPPAPSAAAEPSAQVATADEHVTAPDAQSNVPAQ